MASRAVNPQPTLKAEDINIKELSFGLDEKLTVFKEEKCTVSYETPYFRARANLELPILPAGVNVEIGWIQVSTDMDLIIIYGDQGMVSWEIPELVAGTYTMVSDSDGFAFPWNLGRDIPLVKIQGPTMDKTFVSVYFDDVLKSTVAWIAPADFTPTEPRLSFMYRKQKFYDYLAVKDLNTGTYQILKIITWSMELAIDVNINNPLGLRCELLGTLPYECPTVVPFHLAPPLQCYALGPPTCNTGQALMWRSFDGEIKVVKRPSTTTVDMDKYVIHSDVHTKRLMLINKENYLRGNV